MEHIVKSDKYPSLPTAKDAALAKEATQALSGLVDDDSEVEIGIHRGEARINAVIPSAALQMIVELLAHMSQGNAVTVIPTGAVFTTQQAAHFLNVSRPYLIGLLESGQIPYFKAGRHRKIKFADLRTFKEERDATQQKTLDKLTALSQMAAKEVGEGY